MLNKSTNDTSLSKAIFFVRQHGFHQDRIGSERASDDAFPLRNCARSLSSIVTRSPCSTDCSNPGACALSFVAEPNRSSRPQVCMSMTLTPPSTSISRIRPLVCAHNVDGVKAGCQTSKSKRREGRRWIVQQRYLGKVVFSQACFGNWNLGAARVMLLVLDFPGKIEKG